MVQTRSSSRASSNPTSNGGYANGVSTNGVSTFKRTGSALTKASKMHSDDMTNGSDLTRRSVSAKDQLSTGAVNGKVNGTVKKSENVEDHQDEKTNPMVSLALFLLLCFCF